MRVDFGDDFGEQIVTLADQFGVATEALTKGDTEKLKKALVAIEKIAHVLIVVLTALSTAKAKR